MSSEDKDTESITTAIVDSIRNLKTAADITLERIWGWFSSLSKTKTAIISAVGAVMIERIFGAFIGEVTFMIAQTDISFRLVPKENPLGLSLRPLLWLLFLLISFNYLYFQLNYNQSSKTNSELLDRVNKLEDEIEVDKQEEK